LIGVKERFLNRIQRIITIPQNRRGMTEGLPLVLLDEVAKGFFLSVLALSDRFAVIHTHRSL
jgi:hypothetical protein